MSPKHQTSPRGGGCVISLGPSEPTSPSGVENSIPLALPHGVGVRLYTVNAFEWDPEKATSNARKHGIQFADAVTVLEDDRSVNMRDDSADEERWVTMGMDGEGRVLVVVYTWQLETIRKIPPRPATKGEARQNTKNI